MRSKRSNIPQIVVLIILALGVLGRILPKNALSPNYRNSPANVELNSNFSGKCVGVSDGDTISVMHNGYEEKIRLFGVDSPELDQAFGKAAKRFTSEMVFGKTVNVDVRDKDRYGRTVGWVKTKNGRILNIEIVRAGLAWWYRYYAPYDNKLANLETQAHKARRGLWRETNPTPPWDYRREKRERAL